MQVIRAEMQKDAKPDLALVVDIWSLGYSLFPFLEVDGAYHNRDVHV